MEVQDDERFLKHVYRTAPIGLCLFDSQLRYRHINEWLAAINGISVEAHLGRTISEVIPDVSAEVKSILRGVMETGEPVLDGVVEARTPASPHQTRIFQHSYHPLRTDEGVVVGVSCIVQDITTRKRAEEELIEARNQLEERVQARTAELAQSELRHRVLLESTNAVPWEADATTWQFTYVGPQAIKLLGYPPQQWLEANFWPLHIHPEDREFAIDYCLRSAKSEADFDFEYRMIAADGRTVWIHDIVNVQFEAGEPKTLRGFMIDITERKQAEMKLRISEQRYRSVTDDVLDKSAVGIFILDSDFSVVWLNSSIEEYFGIKRDDCVGKDKRTLVIEDIQHIFEDPQGFSERVIATYDKNTSTENFECRILADGKREERWLEHWSQPITSGLYKGGRVEHYTDITKRKQLEEKLIEANKQTQAEYSELKQLYKNIPVGLCLVDSDLRYIRINKMLADVNGSPVDEHIGKTVRDIIPQLADEAEKHYRFVIETGQPVLDVEISGVTLAKPKEVRSWLASFYPMTFDNGEACFVSTVVKDITEQEQAKEKLLKNRDDMRELARRLITAHEDERRRMARELHDDLSQRLASIAIDSSMLENEIRPATESGADKLATLSDRIRATSVDVHQVSRQLHPSILDDLGLVKAMQAECDAFQRRSGIALRFEGPSEYTSAAKSTELALYRIMQECLRNIEKHSRAVSACVTLHVNEAEISLTVADTGTGFDPTQQREEPGLGMASLKERAGLLGGSVSIQSEIGRGTTVTAHLPAKTRES